MDNKLVEWVMTHVDEWRNHRDTNYKDKWDEYERLWRGEWSHDDRTRDSERSRVISPALQQAIESHTAEIEEAVFGQSAKFFAIDDDFRDTERVDVEYIEKYLSEQFKKNQIRKSIGDIILLASIYGTGIGELIVKETEEKVPTTSEIPDVGAEVVTVENKTYVCVKLKPVHPKNFIIDPNATTIQEAMGVAIEEFVSAHLIAEGIKDGIYKDVPIEESSPDDEIEPSSIDDAHDKNKVRILRYYGLVPTNLLYSEEEEYVNLLNDGEEDEEELESRFMKDYGDMVEAIVVIINGQDIIKAEKTPYMMEDRPIVSYQDDTIPGRFWGRGIAEKGYNMQKSADAQIRSHLDSLALTTAPMMGIDSTRLPRGAKFEVRAGRSILTNGNPSEVLMPFKFGNTDPTNIQTAKEFERMLLMATGTLDSGGLPSMTEGTEAGIFLALSGLIKKNKRTLVNFQDQFLIPFITKTAWRYMQFDPDNMPAKDWKFVPLSSMGMMAREIEQLQFINLLKTLGPDSQVSPVIMQGVLENSSLSNKQEIITLLKQSMQPDPKQQQIQQAQQELQLKAAVLELERIQSEIDLNKAKATETLVSAQVKPEETKAKLLAAINENIPDQEEAAQREFDRRVKVAELMLKEKDINQNAEVVRQQMAKQVANG